MATPSDSGTQSAAQEISPTSVLSPDLERQLQSAADDFERGDYIELSAEELERCVATGASPC